MFILKMTFSASQHLVLFCRISATKHVHSTVHFLLKIFLHPKSFKEEEKNYFPLIFGRRGIKVNGSIRPPPFSGNYIFWTSNCFTFILIMKIHKYSLLRRWICKLTSRIILRIVETLSRADCSSPLFIPIPANRIRL